VSPWPFEGVDEGVVDAGVEAEAFAMIAEMILWLAPAFLSAAIASAEVS
jgi:hypothetical protein